MSAVLKPESLAILKINTFLFVNKTLWSAVGQPIGQGTNGPSNYLSAVQDFISLCVYYDLYGPTKLSIPIRVCLVFMYMPNSAEFNM